MYEIWQWKKAIARLLVILTLVAGTGGLVSCGFGGGGQETDQSVDENENQPGQTEEKDNDDDENQQENSEEKVDND